MQFPKTDRTRLRRLPARGHYDRDTVYSIIDESLICHVGIVDDGQPVVIPTIHARQDDELILHGANASRLLKVIQAGAPLCVTITLLDGLVLARSVFHHSMNYRSVVLYGQGRLVETPAEKLRALETLTEHLMRGRWADARRPTTKELSATTVVAIPIETASAKIRTGPPGDDAEDYELPIWAGVLPTSLTFGAPQADPALTDGIPLPDYVADYER